MKSCFKLIILKLSQYTFLSLLTLCLSMPTLLAEKGFAQNKSVKEITVQLKKSHVTVEKVFKTITSQTDFTFNYSKELIDIYQRVRLSIGEFSVEEALLQLSKEASLSFRQVNNTISVKPIQSEKDKPLEIKVREDLKVSGKVSDENGQGLPGVSVVVKESTTGTITDSEGIYSINADESAILVFSYIGYETRELAIAGRSIVDISMTPDVAQLEEIVVIGYGVQSKREVSGAISSVSSEDLGEVSVDAFGRALTGKIAGVQVQQTTGAPGGNIVVRVRGASSLSAGNDPLYVIDGFPVEQSNIGASDQGFNPLSSLNPDDIASIDVLKDASAAAIYGSRGANGVVIITTKRGSSGRAKLNFNASYGVQSVINKVDLMNADEYLDFVRESYQNAAATNAPDLSLPDFIQNGSQFQGTDTDWQDEIFRPAIVQNYQLSASGGTDDFQYFISGGYLNEEGVVLASDYERVSLRINLDAQLTERIKWGVNFTPSFGTYDEVNAEGHWAGNAVINMALINFPFLRPDQDSETFVNADPNYSCCGVTNPVTTANDFDAVSTQFRTLGNTFLEIDLIEGLKFKTSLGIDLAEFERNEFNPARIQRNNNNNTANSRKLSQRSWLAENTINYTKSFNEHSLSVLGGFTYQEFREQNNFIGAEGLTNELLPTINDFNAVNNASSFVQEWALVSLIGRVNYAYRDKYFLTGTVRRDGSSRFGSSNRFATFPSISAGWSIYEEPFLNDITTLSELKLRASYGASGNNRIGNYASIGRLTDETYVFGSDNGASVTGLRPENIGNDDLTWETTKQFDIGLEVGLFDDRLFLIADYYNSKTENLLLAVPIPTSSGFSSSLQNLGEIRNKGWEFSVSSKNFVGDFSWSTGFNIYFNNNEVLKLGPAGDPILSNGAAGQVHITEIGGELGAFYLLKQEGIFQTQQEIDNSPTWDISRGTWPGDVRYEDVNGDKMITADDRTVVGNVQPDFIWGLTNTLNYQNFDFTLVINGVQGNDVLNFARRFTTNVEGNQNQLARANDRWRSPGDPGNGTTPRANRVTSGNNNQPSTRWLEDASFIRIQNLTLGYNFPSSIVDNLKIRSLRVYGAINNLAYITNYSGYNPEVSAFGGSPLTPGEDYGSYPLSRRFTLGVKMGF